MPPKIPKTYFSTPLSGSAKETELRIRNLFQGQKKRPALPVMVLAVVLIALCGSIVAFHPRAAEPVLVMDVQYYDVYGNYIEIPALAMPLGSELNQAVSTINQELSVLKDSYQRLVQEHPSPQDLVDTGNQCLFYPSTTQRYLNLVFYCSDHLGGHIRSLVYDKKEGVQVHLEDAFEQFGLSESELCTQLSDQIYRQQNTAASMLGEVWTDISRPDVTLDGFRITADGSPVFYLTAAVSGQDRLYIWAENAFTLWDADDSGHVPLVPAEETDQFSPPLWCQWYLEGGEPAGGFARPEDVTEGDPALLEALLTPVLENGYPVEERHSITRQVLASLPGETVTLAAAVLVDQHRYVLSIGPVDNKSGALAAPVFSVAGSGGLPHVAAFTREDGTLCLLYTANGMHLGFGSGQAGLIVLDGEDLTWEWPVQGDVRDESSQAYDSYQAYWEHHKALLVPGGVEVFAEHSSFGPYDGSPPQWEPEYSQLFYAAQEDTLPAGTLWNVRTWLEDFTRSGRNPHNAVNVSSAWRITSLLQTKTHYPGRESGQLSLNLECQADDDDTLFLSASLIYDPGTGQVTQVVDWSIGSWEDVHPDPGSS